MLAIGVVYHDHREAQGSGRGHYAQAVYTGRRLLTAADNTGNEVCKLLVHEVDKVAAVINDDVGAYLQHLAQAVLILLLGAAVLGKDVHAAGSKRRGNIILRGKRIRARDVHFRSAELHNAAEIRGLRLKMDRQRDLESLKGLFIRKAAADTAQNGHVALDPVYFHLARRRKAYIFNNAHKLTPFFTKQFILTL